MVPFTSLSRSLLFSSFKKKRERDPLFSAPKLKTGRFTHPLSPKRLIFPSLFPKKSSKATPRFHPKGFMESVGDPRGGSRRAWVPPHGDQHLPGPWCGRGRGGSSGPGAASPPPHDPRTTVPGCCWIHPRLGRRGDARQRFPRLPLPQQT